MSKKTRKHTKTFQYRGFKGSAEVSIEDRCLYGKILGIDDFVLYEGNTVDELEDSFRYMVSAYLKNQENKKN